MRKCKILGLAMGMLIPFIALAQNNNVDNNRFVYVEAASGYDNYTLPSISMISGSTTLSSITPDDSSNGTLALSAAIGYQFTKYLAAEIGFINTSKFDVPYTYTVIGQPDTAYSIGVNPWSVYAAGKISFPIIKKLEGFVKLGVAYQKANMDVTDTNIDFFQGYNNDGTYSPLLGLGLQYDITPKVYVFGQSFAYLFTDDLSDNNFFPLDFGLTHNYTVLFGVGYKFK